ncbi:hypothetical protein [Shewanella xiamenensis]|uniref:hypothetical protein n=1 Tax=Shewanella xiamenensis TaxID=332186 RepID=UPI00313E7598
MSKTQNSGQEQNYYHLKAGDTDTDLNKHILEVILGSENFCVYLDTDCFVQWKTSDEHQGHSSFGAILNKVASLEAQSQFIVEPSELRTVRRRIGEGLARCLSGYSAEDSFAALHEVEADIKAKNRVVSWRWYFISAMKLTGAAVILFGLMWLFRICINSFIGETAFEIILGTLCGSMGALLSVMTRSDRLVIDANAGEFLHHLEGYSRIVAGLIGGFLVALAVKAKIFSGGVTFSGNELALMLLFCTIAGASERLVPSLIMRVDKLISSSDK